LIYCFTHFAELYAVPDTIAINAAQVLLQHFGRYECAHQLLSDNGSKFLNSIIEELIKMVVC
jgi:hypothetical protein